MKPTFAILLSLALCSCQSPYKKPMREAQNAYIEGRMSPDEYQRRMSVLLQQDQAWRENAARTGAALNGLSGNINAASYNYHATQQLYAPPPVQRVHVRGDVYHHHTNY